MTVNDRRFFFIIACLFTIYHLALIFENKYLNIALSILGALNFIVLYVPEKKLKGSPYIGIFLLYLLAGAQIIDKVGWNFYYIFDFIIIPIAIGTSLYRVLNLKKTSTKNR